MQYCVRHKIFYHDDHRCMQCITKSPDYKQSDEVEVTYCKNKDEAQALANFLWNEKERHLKDVREIDLDIVSLEIRWEVRPNKIRAFVKP